MAATFHVATWSFLDDAIMAAIPFMVEIPIYLLFEGQQGQSKVLEEV